MDPKNMQYFITYWRGRFLGEKQRKFEREKEFSCCDGELFPSSTWLRRRAFRPWRAPGMWCLAVCTMHMGCPPECVCVFICVWRDSCPAHLPPLWPATFIINPDDQVAMSLCPCQGMPPSDLWTSIRHSSVHVYHSCTAWLTWLPRHGAAPCGFIMKKKKKWQDEGISLHRLSGGFIWLAIGAF